MQRIIITMLAELLALAGSYTAGYHFGAGWPRDWPHTASAMGAAAGAGIACLVIGSLVGGCFAFAWYRRCQRVLAVGEQVIRSQRYVVSEYLSLVGHVAMAHGFTGRFDDTDAQVAYLQKQGLQIHRVPFEDLHPDDPAT